LIPIDFRQLTISFVHPRDRDGELLIRQFQRWGGTVEHAWPSPPRLERSADIVVALISRDTQELCRSLAEPPLSVLVGVLDGGDGGSLRLLVEASPHAVLAKPFNPTIVLTSLIVARQNHLYQKRLRSKVAKLEDTLRSARKIERAKAVLMQTRHLDESEAYAYLREQAMKKRMPIGAIAGVVVESDEVLPSAKE
jgi:AmiR/NasT family two-component response regulator